MPDSPSTNPRVSHARRNLLVLAAVLVLAAAAAGGYGLWYILVGPGSPAAVGLGPPVVPVVPVVPAGSTTAAPATLDGSWQVDTSLGSFSDFSDSWVGYRVQEQLVGIGGHVAVGRTSKVSGGLTLQGARVTALSVTADLTALTSDDSNRDRQLRRQAIATDTYPTSTFALTSPIDLGTLPAEGQTITATATGDLTLHGVTRTVALAVQAVRQGGVIAVTGSTTVVFADYGFSGPSAFSVVSVDDHGIMELHLLFTHT